MEHEEVLLLKRREMQDKLIFKLIGKIRKSGFQHLKMEDIAKLMDVSRATLYKYFSNKEEIIGRFTDGLITYIKGMENTEQEFNFYNGFQQHFEQSVSLALLITDEFLQELKNTYPDIYVKLTVELNKRNEQLKAYYTKGMEQNVFNKINPTIIILQNHLFNTLFDPKYLMTNQLTIDQALRDFYHLQKVQLFLPQHVLKVNDDLMEPKINYLTQKITNILYT
ncbi:transcriptional regulator, TetR family [Peribacillus simplex]|uniref:Transcriptional regulator, TetR family n=1 Tax=Peribacillus simplex TaxID=1478 RepID=A0A9X8WMX1_9BACI|nr:TetR/AcrR family transcriptional regulator [Peribacillus simplex]SIS02540.1 transcriptional regulator, TetR family [Peribacillus simplex]